MGMKTAIQPALERAGDAELVDRTLAGDMRALVRQRIAAGESGTQVRDWLIKRYGDYVSYDPPMSQVSAPLWIAPVALLLIGALIASRSFKWRKR